MDLFEKEYVEPTGEMYEDHTIICTTCRQVHVPYYSSAVRYHIVVVDGNGIPEKIYAGRYVRCGCARSVVTVCKDDLVVTRGEPGFDEKLTEITAKFNQGRRNRYGVEWIYWPEEV